MTLFALLVGGVAVLIALAGVFRWASGDTAVEREAAKEKFRAEQSWRGMRRAGKL